MLTPELSKVAVECFSGKLFFLLSFSFTLPKHRCLASTFNCHYFLVWLATGQLLSWCYSLSWKLSIFQLRNFCAHSAHFSFFFFPLFSAIMRYMGDLAMVKNQNEVDCVYTILVVSWGKDVCTSCRFTQIYSSLPELPQVRSNSWWNLLSADEADDEQQEP